MSDQKPPPDPEEQPAQPPPAPYGGPAYPPPQAWGPPGQVPPPRTGLSRTGQFWIGVVLAVPALLVTAFIGGAVGSVLGGASGSVGTIVGAVVLLAPVVLLFFRQTRMYAVGILVGYAVLLIVLAGACVVLLSSLSGSTGS